MSSNSEKSIESPMILSKFGEPWPEFNAGLTYSDSIRPVDSGKSVIEFYETKYKSSAPLQGWLQRIHKGQISIDGRVVTEPTAILRVGSELVYHRLPWKESEAPYLLEVLYEDDHLIALNKPSGLQVLPGGQFQQRTVLAQLQWQEGKLHSFSGCQKSVPVPVHRLGRGTSGILICAKTKVAKTHFATCFADGTSLAKNSRCTSEKSSLRKISKVYRTLVAGLLDQDEVIIGQPIGMVQYPGVAKGLYVACPSGKPSLSKVNVLERDLQGSCTLVQVEIQSGRPHQIRIHLSFIGHPLVGDPLYVSGGQPENYDTQCLDGIFAQDGGYQKPENPVPGDCGYHLHAHKVVFPHPTTNEMIEVVAPLPSMLQTREEKERL